MTSPEEWLTIAEAAARLGVQERQARRIVDRLPDSDRTPPGERPARVRLAALPDPLPVEIWPDQPPAGRDRAPIDAETLSGPSETAVRTVSEMSEYLSGHCPDFWRAQLEEKDRQLREANNRLAEANALAVNAQKLHYNDQQELRQLRERLAISEAPAEPVRRGWMQGLLARIWRRND